MNAASPVQLVPSLLAFHQRIREVLHLARALAAEPTEPPARTEEETAQVVARDAETIATFFARTLPLHETDEEGILQRRLRGQSTELDQALERMTFEHIKHIPLVWHVTGACLTLGNDPARWPRIRQTMHDAVTVLARSFEAHMASEEEHIFPHLRTVLSAEEQAHVALQLRTNGPLPTPRAR